MRVIRILFLIVVVFALGNYFVRHSKIGRQVDADVKIEQMVKETQARLPIQVSANATLDYVSYENRTLQFHGAAKQWFPRSAKDDKRIHDAMLVNYCKMDTLVDANIPVEVTITVPPETLNDKVSQRTTTFQPSECKA